MRIFYLAVSAILTFTAVSLALSAFGPAPVPSLLECSDLLYNDFLSDTSITYKITEKLAVLLISADTYRGISSFASWPLLWIARTGTPGVATVASGSFVVAIALWLHRRPRKAASVRSSKNATRSLLAITVLCFWATGAALLVFGPTPLVALNQNDILHAPYSPIKPPTKDRVRFFSCGYRHGVLGWTITGTEMESAADPDAFQEGFMRGRQDRRIALWPLTVPDWF